MGDNWVIYRGAWTAKHILDDPPQLPPLEVPSSTRRQVTTNINTRELMIQHREDPKCNVCHTKLDPIGFAFQNFDLSERWRGVEHASYQVDELDGKIAWRGKERQAGRYRWRIAGGQKYRTYDEFKEILIRDYQDGVVAV